MSQNNPAAKLGHMRQVRLGLVTNFPLGTETIEMKGVPQPVSAVVQRMDVYIGIYQGAENAHKALTTKVEVRDAAEPAVDDFLADVRAGVTPKFGPKSQALKDFGFPPKRGPKKLTGKANAAKGDRAKRTRQDNHTMGRRQRKAAKQTQNATSNGVSQGTEPTHGGTQAAPTPGGTGK